MVMAVAVFVGVGLGSPETVKAIRINQTGTSTYVSTPAGSYTFGGTLNMTGSKATAISSYPITAGLSVGVQMYYYFSADRIAVTDKIVTNSNAGTSVSATTGTIGYGGITAYGAHEITYESTLKHLETKDTTA